MIITNHLCVHFAGKLTEYEESERITVQLASSIKTLYRGVNIICTNDGKMAAKIQRHTKALLNAINSNLRNGTWEKKEISAGIDVLDVAAVQLVEKGMTSPLFLVNMRNEISNIDKLANRIQDIKESIFIQQHTQLQTWRLDGDIRTICTNCFISWWLGSAWYNPRYSLVSHS